MRDKIEEIHLRHNRAHMAPSDWWTVMGADAHQDRAFLLNKVWEMRAEIERLREVLRGYAYPASISTNNQGNTMHYDGGARARKALEEP